MTAPSRTNGMAQEVIKASCTSKNRYSDQLTAIAMGITQSKRNGVKLFAYRCRICRGWHLTRDGRGRNGNQVVPCTENIFSKD